ncbi:hypothetical protein VTL71DRAFT_15519 [Oculimacula yallundae]|uniref:Uncharacterized protein n=1 Tax=Oculimacula yallundae TaxID=86028 RepID=A0ABR4CIX2_9HELO
MLLKYVFALTASALCASAAGNAPQCNADNCLRAVQASAFPTRPGTADCSSYFRTTVTPATLTVTTTLSLTRSTGITLLTSTTTTATSLKTSTQTASSTTKTTAIVTETILSTSTIVQSTSETVTDVATVTSTSTVTVTVPGGAQNDKRSGFLNINPPLSVIQKRQQTARPTGIPTYASACSGSVRYSSACSCIGVRGTTITAATPTFIVTVSNTNFQTSTKLATSTFISQTTVTVVRTETTTLIVPTTFTTQTTLVIETSTTQTNVVTDSKTSTELTTTTTTTTAAAVPTIFRVRLLNPAGTFVGYIGNGYNAFGERGRTQDVQNALQIIPDLTAGSTTGTQRQLLTQNSAAYTDLIRLGFVNGFANNGHNMGPGTYNYAYGCGTISSPPGPSISGDNTFTRSTSISQTLEASVWNVNLNTLMLSPVWINDDGSAPTIYALLYQPTTDNGILVITGDKTAFRNQFGSDDIELTFQLEAVV